MRSQNKLDLLRQEMENRNRIPDPDGVWNQVEGRLKWRNIRKKLIGVSLFLLAMFAFVWLFFNTDQPSSLTTDSGLKTSSQTAIEADSSIKENTVNDPLPNQKKNESIADASNATIHSLKITDGIKTETSKQELFEKAYKRNAPSKVSQFDRLNKVPGSNKKGTESSNFKEDLVLNDPNVNSVENDKELKHKIEESMEDSMSQPDSGIDVLKDKKVDETVAKKNEKSDDKDSNAYVKKFVIRPNIGLLFNQLKPYSIPGKSIIYNLTSNFSAGLALDYTINNNSMLSFNIGFMRMPCKIEYLDKGTNSSNDIVKVFSGNFKTIGFDYSYGFPGRKIGLNIGQRLAFSGKKFNYLVDNRKGELIYKKQEELPESIRNNYFQKLDFLINAGVTYKINQFGFKLNYYQGLIDVSKATKLFNPHSFIELNCSFDLFRF
ncbi:MAG TPA: hypothetical protein VGF79_10455 [Bacteroidia bacterium]